MNICEWENEMEQYLPRDQLNFNKSKESKATELSSPGKSTLPSSPYK